jgi:ATP-dependent DNA helicase DinG
VAKAFQRLGKQYEPRHDQQLVATVVEQALGRQNSLRVGIVPIEAGTGIGKTLAYLCPGALHATATGSRMLVSTHTIALGAQIMRKDGPIAQDVVEMLSGTRPRIAHMRGRTHFVSPSRALAVGSLLRDDGLPPSAWQPYLDVAHAAGRSLDLALQALADDDHSEEAEAIVVASMLDTHEEAMGVPLARDDICLLASSHDDELAAHRLSRKLATTASILVTTHAYTATGLARKALFGATEEPFALLVVDEADQWASAAASVSLVSASMAELRRSIDAILSANRHAKSTKNTDRIAQLSTLALESIDALAELAPTAPGRTTALRADDSAIKLLGTICSQADEIIVLAAQRRSHTAAASDVLRDRTDDLKRITNATQNNETDFWVPHWTTSRIHGLPSIGVKGKMPGRIMKRLWAGASDSEPLARTIILTSATLSTPGFGDVVRWKSIELATGADPLSGMVLTDLACTIQPSDFGRMKVCFADPRAPIPRADYDNGMATEALDYAVAVIKAAMADSAARGGRTLVLVPSFADASRLSLLLPGVVTHREGKPLKAALELYRAMEGCCLITPGAWYGTDLPGLVQNLVIPRIPYPPRNPDSKDSMAHHLSETLAKLSQGVGRGIRCKTDDVTIWFADPRMPVPDTVVAQSGVLRSSHFNTMLLSAIPKRFRDAFDAADGTSTIGVPYEPGINTERRTPSHQLRRTTPSNSTRVASRTSERIIRPPAA